MSSTDLEVSLLHGRGAVFSCDPLQKLGDLNPQLLQGVTQKHEGYGV